MKEMEMGSKTNTAGIAEEIKQNSKRNE